MTQAPAFTAAIPTLDTDGVPIHLVAAVPALDVIVAAAERHPQRPLAVASINLDHLHHFGRHTRRSGPPSDDVEWLNLIDGSPIAAFARRATGQAHPKLSGSDLVHAVLDRASERGLSVAVLGGRPSVSEPLRRRLAERWPSLRLAGHWTPSPAELDDPAAAAELTRRIRAAGPDILLVCLGKPRQETWIGAHGARTGAGALLAFGAVVDFLAGAAARAPRWVSESGLEWAWRLAREPRRLARRYLVQGPPAYVALHRSPHALREGVRGA
ncbi:WecB/TagA/CpsF family glycosyltransferase [Microbacterium sp. Marseille-Q6965]|uniref:WecB/TagA/CpsF family glycosyltransferase n=1 Tax=Microbacterium sp. Marseille-Q6965 TaxID=2965072 RepID=UPI0021B77A43|nr:WecB/TagA/CpsF family glycosyltransferase [Microbacterium sp. Marseille-Q6965]